MLVSGPWIEISGSRGPWEKYLGLGVDYFFTSQETQFSKVYPCRTMKRDIKRLWTNHGGRWVVYEKLKTGTPLSRPVR